MSETLNINLNLQSVCSENASRNQPETFVNFEKLILDILKKPNNYDLKDFSFKFYNEIFNTDDIFDVIETSGAIQSRKHFFTIHLFKKEDKVYANNVFNSIFLPIIKEAERLSENVTLIEANSELYIETTENVNSFSF